MIREVITADIREVHMKEVEIDGPPLAYALKLGAGMSTFDAKVVLMHDPDFEESVEIEFEDCASLDAIPDTVIDIRLLAQLVAMYGADGAYAQAMSIAAAPVSALEIEVDEAGDLRFSLRIGKTYHSEVVVASDKVKRFLRPTR